jgi:GPH family glycoside/pentoside/hexuronide:cation symporter
MVMSTQAEKLSLTEKVGYAMGDTASNLFWMTFVFFGNYFYTDVFGISPAAMAALFFVTRIWDAINDPLMGMIADRTNTRWGKFRPFILWLVFPFGICGALAFVTPPFGDYGKLIWAYVTYTLIGMIYTAINLPYSALMGVISPSSEERTKVSGFRFVGAYSGGLIVSLTTKGLVGVLGGDSEQVGFALTVGLFAIVAVVLFLVTFVTTKERVQPKPDPEASFVRDLGDVLTNVPWLILFLLGIFTLGYVSVRNGAVVYYFKYYVGEQTMFGIRWTADGFIPLFFTSGSIATIVGTMLTAPIARKIGKRVLYIILMGLASVLTIAFYFLSPEDVVAMFVLQILTNMIMGPTAALVFAMYADASDYAEWQTGRRSTGLVFAASSFAQKMGWTIGGTVTGTVLAAFGYQANMDQAPSALTGLRLLMSFIPAAGSVLAALLPLVYTLNDGRMKTIESDLEARRRGEQPMPSADENRDRLGRILGAVAGLAAVGLVVYLLYWATTKAIGGDFLYIVYIVSIVSVFGCAILWIRHVDAKERARLAPAAGAPATGKVSREGE